MQTPLTVSAHYQHAKNKIINMYNINVIVSYIYYKIKVEM